MCGVCLSTCGAGMGMRMPGNVWEQVLECLLEYVWTRNGNEWECLGTGAWVCLNTCNPGMGMGIRVNDWEQV